MVIPLDPDVVAALEQSHGVSMLVQAFYGAAQTVPGPAFPNLPDGVPVTADGSITFQSDGQIQANGSVYVARDGGDSLVPVQKTDPLAPFGQEISPIYVVDFGGDVTYIPLGRYRITEVPDAVEFFRRFPALDKVVGWSVQLNIADRFDQIIADEFLTVTAPISGNSTWEEIRRLSPIPIEQGNFADPSLPAGIVYTGRYDGITQLMSNLGCEPALTRQGALTARIKDRWLTADPDVPDFTVDGTIAMSSSLSNDLVNSVIVTNPNNAAIIGIAEITDESNPLAITNPIGRRTYTKSDPLMDTQAKADAAAATILARLSSQLARTATISCLPRPDLELGDCGWCVDQISSRRVFGEIKGMTFSMDPTQAMSITLSVAAVESLAIS